MECKDENKNSNSSIINSLKPDCENCYGFCCVALYFSASEGFPVNKAAGKPCPNLQKDFRCRVHGDLGKLGLKGCISYDCLGAGQKVARVTYKEHDWLQFPESAKQMYDVYLIMVQIHEMLWYLAEALTLEPEAQIHDEIKSMLLETEGLTFLDIDSLVKTDVAAHRSRVNTLLVKTSELVRGKFKNEGNTFLKRLKQHGSGVQLIGADLRRTNLRGENLRGAYLIAANLNGADLSGVDFIGADLRDADIRGADMTDSIFLTQAQISTARGDSRTKLPEGLLRPMHWSK